MYYKYIYTFAAKMITKLATVTGMDMHRPLNADNPTGGGI